MPKQLYYPMRNIQFIQIIFKSKINLVLRRTQYGYDLQKTGKWKIGVSRKELAERSRGNASLLRQILLIVLGFTDPLLDDTSYGILHFRFSLSYSH